MPNEIEALRAEVTRLRVRVVLLRVLASDAAYAAVFSVYGDAIRAKQIADEVAEATKAPI